MAKEGLSKKQRTYLRNSTASFNIATGAVSSGKTFAQVLRWDAFVFTEVPEGALLMMSGKTAESLYDNIIHLWESIDPEHIEVTRQPLRSSLRTSSGMAVISLLFSTMRPSA